MKFILVVAILILSAAQGRCDEAKGIITQRFESPTCQAEINSSDEMFVLNVKGLGKFSSYSGSFRQADRDPDGYNILRDLDNKVILTHREHIHDPKTPQLWSAPYEVGGRFDDIEEHISIDWSQILTGIPQITGFRDLRRVAIWAPGEVIHSGPFYKRLSRQIDCGVLKPIKISRPENLKVDLKCEPEILRDRNGLLVPSKNDFRTRLDNHQDDSLDSCEKRVKGIKNGVFCQNVGLSTYLPGDLSGRYISRYQLDLDTCLKVVANSTPNELCVEFSPRNASEPSGFIGAIQPNTRLLSDPYVTFKTIGECVDHYKSN